jgi:hypothetical protein
MALKRWLKVPHLASPECLLLVLAIFSRLIPHAPNFTALGAVALFSGFFFPKRTQALTVPLVAMILSDLVIGFHGTLLWVYGALILISILGRYLQDSPGRHFSWSRLGGFSMLSATLFFVVTNFGVWTLGTLYSRDLAGLSSCFVAAIPFFGNTLGSQMIFGVLLFGVHRILRKSRLMYESPAKPFQPAS